MRIISRILSLCLLLGSTQFIYAQSADRDLAQEKYKKAVAIMDEGQIEASVTLLKEAMKLDPSDPVYLYEIGYARYLAKEYDEAIDIFKKLSKRDDATPRVYQMLGNIYDYAGKPAKAIDTYEAGIKRFPNAGGLYLERGNMETAKKEYNKAIVYYEAGVKADPAYPSNYYWLAKLFCSSQDEVWGMLYGELFMNLERGSKRTTEIGKLLYYTYKSEIKFPTDTSMSVSFSKGATIYIPMDKKKKADPDALLKALQKQPFGTMIYEVSLMLGMAEAKVVNLATLNKGRNGFLEVYYQKEFEKKYPNVLFDYQQQLVRDGYFEAYNYWLLGGGEESGQAEWIAGHKEKWDAFMSWFKDNPINVTKDNHFCRPNYL